MGGRTEPVRAGGLEDPLRLDALPSSAVVENLRLSGDETVVDYGAGTGYYTVAVAEAVPNGHVIAVEALPRMADLIRRRIAGDLAGRLVVVETDENRVPLEDGEADRILMVDVLHHVHDDPGALLEVVRVLRSGGLFVIIDWGDVERPVGPPLDHVLDAAAVCGLVARMGLEVVSEQEPGEQVPYHRVVVARRPSVGCSEGVN